MTTVVALDAIPRLVGTTFSGAPMTVTRAERDGFEDLTHLTEAYPDPDAPEFGEDIVEGFHSLALLDAACTLVQRFDPDTTYAYNYGLDRVRFVSPVHIGDRLETTVTVREAVPHGGGWKMLRECTLSVPGAPKPSLVAEWWVLVLPRTLP